MREIRQSGSEGGEAGNLTGLPYPYRNNRLNTFSGVVGNASNP